MFNETFGMDDGVYLEDRIDLLMLLIRIFSMNCM